MIQFWDYIYFEKISQIIASGFDFEQEEKEELNVEYIKATKKNIWNKKFQICFMIFYILVNLVILGINFEFITATAPIYHDEKAT